MLPSFVSNLIWGPPAEEESGGASLEHSTSEEPGDWLLISCGETEDAATGAFSVSFSCESDRYKLLFLFFPCHPKIQIQ